MFYDKIYSIIILAMIEEIKRVTKGNILVMMLLGAIGIVATPVSLGSSWVAFESQKSINHSYELNVNPEPLTVHFRNIFFLMSVVMGPCAYFSSYFLYKMLTAK
jgi:multisubunit Na+/H+ antiporter MnhB subunit